MMRTMLAGKIHRATVTEANVDYEGSITIDPDLLEAAGILPYELVQVLDITNGARLETYAIEGERGSGAVCVNGAAGLSSCVSAISSSFSISSICLKKTPAGSAPASCASMPETASFPAPTASKRTATTRS